MKLIYGFRKNIGKWVNLFPIIAFDIQVIFLDNWFEFLIFSKKDYGKRGITFVLGLCVIRIAFGLYIPKYRNTIKLYYETDICLRKPFRSLKNALRYLKPKRLTRKDNPSCTAWLWWNIANADEVDAYNNLLETKEIFRKAETKEEFVQKVHDKGIIASNKKAKEIYESMERSDELHFKAFLTQ